VQHSIFQGGVNVAILELVNLLVDEIEGKGYKFHDGWSWGFGCRATKGGSGDVPSFHSWGLALDFNAPENVFGGAPMSSDINVNNHWIVRLMAQYGFFWLGPSIGDWMHFSFVGDRADAKRLTEKARNNLGGDEVAYAEFKKGWKGFVQGAPKPAVDGDERFGWLAASYAASEPKPGQPVDHHHTVKVLGKTFDTSEQVE
jgi:hypothetical protein